MSAKYFVWGEGVWREIDLASGRVTGWRRRARFVFVRRGRLLVARRRPVLRALETLAAGQPSAAADGPRLSYRSKSKSRTKHNQETPAVPAAPAAPPAPPAPPALPLALPACEHHPCCAHIVHRNRHQELAHGDELEMMCATNDTRRNSRCNNNEKRPVGKRDIATQCAPGLAFNITQKPTTTATATAASDYSSAEEFVTMSGRRPLAAHTKTEANELFVKTPATKPPATAASQKHTPVTKHAADKSGDERRERVRNRAQTGVNDNTDSMSADEFVPRSASSDRQSPVACKELIISDSDVELLRGFVSRTRPSALARFDTDVGYKRKLFHAINPLVHVERCARLERLLHTKRRAIALARPRAQRVASADTDKENKDRHSSPNKVREPVSGIKKSPEKRPAATSPTHASATRLGVSERSSKLEKEVAVIKASKNNSVASKPPRAKPERSKKKAAVARDAGDSTAPGSYTVGVPPGTHVISKRASQPTAKEYSNLEDHAIVAWLSSGSRACLVSGNRVWRDLQEQYEQLTGRERSWHSLRNRYLRYILPSLGALQLPPGDVSRLRAAAATGAIKTKNRRHSGYQTPARGASSRRVRPASSGDSAAGPAGDDTGPPSPKRRSLRSRPLESASKDTSNKDESGDETASKASNTKKVSRQAGGSKPPGSRESGSKQPASEAASSARPPRYSDVTRRFAARRRRISSSPSPPLPPRSPSPVMAPPSRLRRLYNPNTNM